MLFKVILRHGRPYPLSYKRRKKFLNISKTTVFAAIKDKLSWAAKGQGYDVIKAIVVASWVKQSNGSDFGQAIGYITCLIQGFKPMLLARMRLFRLDEESGLGGLYMDTQLDSIWAAWRRSIARKAPPLILALNLHKNTLFWLFQYFFRQYVCVSWSNMF